MIKGVAMLFFIGFFTAMIWFLAWYCLFCLARGACIDDTRVRRLLRGVRGGRWEGGGWDC